MRETRNKSKKSPMILEGSGKTHMMRKMKEIKESERRVVMC